MSSYPVPQANDAEIALIGALMLDSTRITDIAAMVVPTDFFQPRPRRIYAAILELHAAGLPVDVVTVSDALAGEEDASFLLEAMNALPAISRAPHYAGMITEAAQRRSVLMLSSEITRAVGEGEDIPALFQRGEALSKAMRAPAGVGGPVLHEISDWVAEQEARPRKDDWLVPHIIQRRMRTIIVAGEGVGKATLMRQIGLHAAAGIDPFDPNTRMTPVPTLYIDAENQATTILRQVRLANKQIDLASAASGMFTLWHCEEGIDLRSRQGRLELEHALQQCRPSLVLAGPLYKLFRRGSNEDMEQATIEFCEMLDDLRVRYDFAVVLEHHVPKGEQNNRLLVPFGSSVLMRWPEVGIALNDQGLAKGQPDRLEVKVERYRPDRMPTEWPMTITRGDVWANLGWNPTFAVRRGMTVGARRVGGEWAYDPT